MMEKRDNEKVFDANKFVVWKFHMENCFEERSIMKIVDGIGVKSPDSASYLD